MARCLCFRGQGLAIGRACVYDGATQSETRALSNPDSFIDEVTEEVRRDRLFLMLRRYGWIGAVAVIALVGGASWNEWQKAQARAKAEALGDAVLTALDAPDAPARIAGLSGIAATGDAAAMVRLIAAAEALAGPDGEGRAAALAALSAIAEDPAVAPIWREMAALRRLTTPGGDVPDADRRAGLDALSQPGRVFRPLALEQIALDKLDGGDRAGALADFRALAADAQAPSGLRERAGQMIVVLGGEVAGD